MDARVHFPSYCSSPSRPEQASNPGFPDEPTQKTLLDIPLHGTAVRKTRSKSRSIKEMHESARAVITKYEHIDWAPEATGFYLPTVLGTGQPKVKVLSGSGSWRGLPSSCPHTLERER